MGLDLSLRATGIEVLDSNAQRVYGSVIGYGLEKGSSQRERIERTIYLANQIIGLVKQQEVTQVAIEGCAFGTTFGREVLAELHGVVKTQLFLACGIVPLVVPPKSARRVVFGAGCGSAKKKQAQAMLAGRGLVIDELDRVDAYVIALWGLWRLKDGAGHERLGR